MADAAAALLRGRLRRALRTRLGIPADASDAVLAAAVEARTGVRLHPEVRMVGFPARSQPPVEVEGCDTPSHVVDLTSRTP